MHCGPNMTIVILSNSFNIISNVISRIRAAIVVAAAAAIATAANITTSGQMKIFWFGLMVIYKLDEYIFIENISSGMQ